MVQLGRLGRVLSQTVFFPLGSEVVLSSLIDKGATRNIMSKSDIIFDIQPMPCAIASFHMPGTHLGRRWRTILT